MADTIFTGPTPTDIYVVRSSYEMRYYADQNQVGLALLHALVRDTVGNPRYGVIKAAAILRYSLDPTRCGDVTLLVREAQDKLPPAPVHPTTLLSPTQIMGLNGTRTQEFDAKLKVYEKERRRWQREAVKSIIVALDILPTPKN